MMSYTPVPNEYLASVPIRFVRQGYLFLEVWLKLAKSGQPFGCKEQVCNMLYTYQESEAEYEKDELNLLYRSDEEEGTMDEYERGSEDHLMNDLFLGKHNRANTKGTVARIHQIPYLKGLELCSVYKDGSGISAPFACIQMAEMFSDGETFVTVPIYRMDSHEFVRSKPQVGGGETSMPEPLFGFNVKGAKDPLPIVRNLLSAALSGEPGAYTVTTIVGGSILARRDHLPNEIIRSHWGSRVYYEDTFLRFDFVPLYEVEGFEEDQVTVYWSLGIDESKTPDPAIEHWHPLTKNELSLYRRAIVQRLSDYISRRCVQADEFAPSHTSWVCRELNEHRVNAFAKSKHSQ